LDISWAGELAYIPDGIWAYLCDPCFLYNPDKPWDIKNYNGSV
jgi:hypothetical protein